MIAKLVANLLHSILSTAISGDQKLSLLGSIGLSDIFDHVEAI